MKEPSSLSSVRKSADQLLIVGFIVALFAPLAKHWTSGDDPTTGVRERRSIQGRPVLEFSAALRTFPARFDAYYADRFGYRDELVRVHNRFKWFWLGLSPDESIVQGRDDWLFYSAENALEQARGALPFEEAELLGWRRMLESRRDTAADHGAHYIWVCGTMKAQIYPEYLPNALKPFGESRLDEFLEYMALESDVEIIDVRPELLAAKELDEPGDHLYYPLGTHWTHRGSVACMRAILGALVARGIVTEPIPDYSDFDRKQTPKQGDSWAERLYMEDRLLQQRWALVPRAPRIDGPMIPGFPRSQRFRQPGADLPRAMLYHDSFATLLKPLIAHSFSEFTTFWTYRWERALIQQERPDVIIDLMAERMLARLDPLDHFEDPEGALVDEYAISTDVIVEYGPMQIGQKVQLAKAHEHRFVAREPLEGLRIDTDPGGQHLVDLPRFERPAGMDAILALELTAPRPSTIELLLPVAGVPGYARHRAVNAFAEAGRSTIYVRLPAHALDPKRAIRILSLNIEGTWTLHHFEVRAVPPR